jgi:hypothetical protein
MIEDTLAVNLLVVVICTHALLCCDARSDGARTRIAILARGCDAGTRSEEGDSRTHANMYTMYVFLPICNFFCYLKLNPRGVGLEQ